MYSALECPGGDTHIGGNKLLYGRPMAVQSGDTSLYCNGSSDVGLFVEPPLPCMP